MFKMNTKGFTLVELLVVLAILGLLAGIGIPQYMKTLDRSRQAADAAIVAVVQSAVDGYMAETGLGVTEKTNATGCESLQKTTTGKELDVEANSKSLLTSEIVFFRDFLDQSYKAGTPAETVLPTSAFKSKDFQSATWHVTANGKVYVQGNGKTIPNPVP